MGDKIFLQSAQTKMHAAVFVEKAREMAKMLEDREVLAVAARPEARKRAARLAGVPASLFHSLRYRPPKQIAVDVYARLCTAVERQAIAQIGKLHNEIMAARAIRFGMDDRSIREAEDALAKAHAILGETTNETKEERDSRRRSASQFGR